VSGRHRDDGGETGAWEDAPLDAQRLAPPEGVQAPPMAGCGATGIRRSTKEAAMLGRRDGTPDELAHGQAAAAQALGASRRPAVTDVRPTAAGGTGTGAAADFGRRSAARFVGLERRFLR
jgi:hypothetical protein